MAGLDDYVVPHIGYSNQVAKTWLGESIRLIFLDGNHTYPFVLEDFKMWYPFLCPGGVIIFHDMAEDYFEGWSAARF